MKQRTKKECLRTVAAVSDDALLKFWEEVAKRFPEIKTGDLDPHDTFELDLACRKALNRWIENNYPHDEEVCEKLDCGKTKRTFMHGCPNTSCLEEVHGCPVHDDVCGFCREE